MKIKSERYKSPTNTKLDLKVVRDILAEENRFITELWDKLDLPRHALTNNDSDFLKDTSDSNNAAVNSKNKVEFLAAHNKGTGRARSLEELHDKLQALRGKKLDYKEKLLKKRLRNRVLKKIKKDERKGKKNLIRSSSDYGPDFAIKPKPQKPIYNSEGKMVFSKFDFSESGFKSEASRKKDKELKDPKKILKNLEEQNVRLKELERQGDVEKVSELREKKLWKNALDKAEGIKVKDNPELLKKTIKKDMKRKQHSKKKWESRIGGMKNRQEEKQKKRTENIQARKKQVKVNKMKKAAKRGRIIPGF